MFKVTQGALTAFLSRGVVVDRATPSWALLQTHGFGMASMFLLLLPLGIYIARYLKHRVFWYLFYNQGFPYMPLSKPLPLWAYSYVLQSSCLSFRTGP